MNLFKFINFDVKGDDRGILVALEANVNVPFEIKRVYYLAKLVGDAPRGFHAHRKLIQLAICITGSCEMVFDNGIERERRLLTSASQGLLIEPGIWHEMHNFSSDCVFLVLASDYYDESDYIRNYNDFITWSRS